MKKLQKMKLLTIILLGLLTFSCSEDLNEPLLNEPLNESSKNSFILKEGVLKFKNKEELKQLVNEIKRTGAENFYNKEIKSFIDKGYEPLRPYFSENETEEFQSFMEKKGKRLEREQQSEEKTNEEIIFDIEDEIIIDSNFEVLLNFDREIIVDNKLYKYTKNGIYSVEEDNIIDFRDFIQTQSTQNNNGTLKRQSLKIQSLPSGVSFIEMDYGVEISNNEEQVKTLNIQKNTTPRYSNLATTRYSNLVDAKLNFGVEVFRKNPSIWGSVWGYSRITYDWAPNSRRVKVKFWNRNWLLFSSMGVSVRFQKKKRFWRWSYYVKSYPDKVALGVNSLKYSYKQILKPYVSPTVFGDLFYTYKGINYHKNGNISLVKPPKIQFPIDKLLSPDDLYITIVNPFNNRSIPVGQSSEQIVKAVNNAASDLLVSAIRSIPSTFGNNKPNSDTTVSILNILKDGTELTVFNQNWTRDRDNSITKYLALDVPTIGFKSSADDNFLSNLEPSLPNLTTSNYDAGSIDIYGGAFYGGKWYGRRLISSDFE